MRFSESDEFAKELKKLKKRYRTLEDDIAVLKKAITAAPTGLGKHDVVLKSDEVLGLFAVKRRMMCRAVRGSQFRVTYLYLAGEVEVLYIELYYKGDKVSENRSRIDHYFNEVKARCKETPK